MEKCLFCYRPLNPGETDFHPACARKFFGTDRAPLLPYTRDNLSELAERIIRTSASVTGVQAKMSLDIDRGGRDEPRKFTIVGLWGKYIFKPQSAAYRCLPELEDVTMKMAEAAGIRTARHTLIRLADGELGYLTLRMDRSPKGRKISMLDMCQLYNRLTEHKYDGTYPQLAETIKRFSSAPMLDVQRFWEIVLFSWITGNSDMHCKNFSLIDSGNREYVLAPAYDLLAVLLADPADSEEMAMTFTIGGKKSGFDRNTFRKAFSESGISSKVAERIINRMCGYQSQWNALIEASFLPKDLQEAYKDLIRKRLQKLNS
ncbi:MAG: HipA domain-containing protein [Bacteroidales bacterium]|nr:HipA domain-containing protein [Bacteroidales bacterium]